MKNLVEGHHIGLKTLPDFRLLKRTEDSSVTAGRKGGVITCLKVLLSFQLDATFSPNMHICHSSCHPFDGFLMPHKDAIVLKCDSTVQMQPEKPVDDFQCCSVASPNTLWLQFKEKTTYFPIKSQSMTDLEVL